MSANESFYRLFQVSGQAVAAIAFNDLGTGQLNVPELRKVLEEVLPKSQSFEDLEIECEFPKIGRKKLRLNARRIYERGVAKDRILLAMQGGDGKGVENDRQKRSRHWKIGHWSDASKAGRGKSSRRP
jgi:two-component system, chemotaxis family, CheB/CheR fusion protein